MYNMKSENGSNNENEIIISMKIKRNINAQTMKINKQ